MKKLTKIWSIGLSLVLAISMVVIAAPAPADAGELSWTNQSVPSTTNNIIAGVNIVDLDVGADGTTIWAATGGANAYKSTDGGETWSTVTPGIGAVDRIAIAPDNSDIVAVLDTGADDVWVTNNAGSSWDDISLGLVSSPTNDITISPLSADVRYVTVAGSDGVNAEIYYFNLGAAAPAWADTSGWTGSPANLGTAYDEFATVAFSPNFASDQVAVAVSYDSGAGAPIELNMISFNLQQYDDDAGFTGYPVTLSSATPGLNSAVNTADIAVDPNYLGGDEISRIVFVAIDATLGTEDGIYRLKNTSVKQLDAGDATRSVDWDGTYLVAGRQANNVVRRSADALASSPSLSSPTTMKRPGIDAAATDPVVRWAGNKVVAGTSGADASAFSISNDNGKTFNDISLIDTPSPLPDMDDFWVTPDGGKIYLLTNDVVNPYYSLWRYDGSWARVWSTGTAPTGAYIVRGALDNDDVLYIADSQAAGATRMWFTEDAGEERWFPRASRYDIQDLAVQSAEIAYVGEFGDSKVSKTTNKGFTWETAKSTRLSGGNVNSLNLLSEDNLLVGSTTGYVAWTTDGNSTWERVSTQLSQGDPAVATASSLETDGYIYASNDGTTGGDLLVERWQIGQSGTSWKDMGAFTAAELAFPNVWGASGIASVGDALYVLVLDLNTGTDSVLKRTINPNASTPTWSTEDMDTEVMNITPDALRTFAGSSKLMAIDTAAPALRVYEDTLGTAGPPLTTPSDDFNAPVNPVSGAASPVTLSWNRISLATDYDIQVALDPDFLDQLAAGVVGSPVGPTTSNNPSTTIAGANMFPGETYYWRVRVAANGPQQSPWSETRTFTIDALGAVAPDILSPENGVSDAKQKPSFSWSPVSGATQYRFVLANNAELTAPVVDVTTSNTAYALTSELAYGETYYWAVKSVEPVEGGWSAISNFTVMEEPTPTTPPVTVTQAPAPSFTITQTQPPDITIPAPTPAPQIAPAYIWAVIIIGAILVIAVIILIVRTRRTV